MKTPGALFLPLLLLSLAPAAWAQNLFIQGNALSNRTFNSDNGPTNSQLTLDFTITQAGVLQNILTWGETSGSSISGIGQSFELFVLRPLNSTNYQVVFATGYMTVTNVGTNTFAVSGTPFGLQVGDVIAHYGRGIPFSNGTGGPGSVYIAVNLPPPVLNTTIIVPSTTYPLYNDGGRNYAIQVRALGQPFVVTTNSDNGPGSLRQAVLNADAFGSASTINFATNLSGQTITLTNAAGELLLSNNITVDASALTNGISINGNGTHRVFEIASGATTVLTGLTITNGSDPDAGDAGGIYNSGTLTVNRCKITGNASSFWGGGIGNAGTMTVNQSTISANTALIACGIENRGTMTLNQSTVSGHSSAALVAGIDNNVGGTLTLNNSTVTGNLDTAPRSGVGAILNRGSALTLNNSTVAGNSSLHSNPPSEGGAGGIVNDATLNMTNSIVAGNTNGTGLDIYNYAAIALGGGNIIQVITNDATFGGGTETGPAAINAAPFLAALGNYGGPTQTMPPLAGSPAIDAGIVIAGLTTDQRGYPRLSGAHVDIGAVEVNTNTIVTTVTDNVPGSLRNVIAGALPSDLVSFAPNLSGQTILLTGGQIGLNTNLTIDASALPQGIILNGNHASRLFSVNGGTVALNSLTITNGSDAGSGGGGGIVNYATLTLNNCSLLGNTASDPNWGGGGILSYNATLKLNNCTLAGNSADNTVGGGGIFIDNGTVVVNQSTLAVNSGNNSSGGGIFNYIFGTLLVTNSIIAANTATGGQGPDVGNDLSFVAFGGSNLLQTAVYSIDGGTSSGSYITSAPLLAPLGNYGGPTPTMPPLPGSPAINAGAPTAFATDQRGFPRVVGPAPDIGAVESGNAIPGFIPVVTTNSDAIYSIGAGAVSLREAVAFATGNAIITFATSMSGQTITLTNGQITLSQGNWIDGSALVNGIQISGNHNSRIFNIGTNGATLVNLTLINANGGGADGGALYNAGNTVLNYCTFIGNSTGSGGAIKNAGGTLVLNECTLATNSTTGGGGGGIVNYAPLFLNGCTLAGNSAGFFGGAIYSETGAHVTLNDTIAAGNTANDIYNNGTLTLSGQNIVQSISGSSSGTAPINASPQLATLGNYGGPTPTMPPLPGSPAIDAGDDSEATLLPNDQRGYPRLAGAHVDIGAVEGIYNAAGPGTVTNVTRLGNGSIQFGFTNLADANFPVLASTNLNLPLSSWTRIGFATNNPAGSGNYQFTDPKATNYPQRFYRIRSP